MCLGAALMALSESGTLLDQFTTARGVLDEVVPRRRRVGRTYQGFVKALMKTGATLLPQLQSRLRAAMQRVAGKHWTRLGWVMFAVDGTKIDCVRSAANESFFGIAGKNKSAPQQLQTTLWHMGLGLPWAWVTGRSDDSEVSHLRQMIPLLPPGCLLVMDAFYRGFELLCQLQDRDMFFLLRVGANVKLLRNLGYAVEERGDTVYLWPQCHRNRPPLVLRLIVVVGPHGKVHLLTNVLDDARLPEQTAAVIYRMRWGVEMFHRALKQTLRRRKMRSAAPRQAVMELHWTLIGHLLLGLMSVSAIIKRGKDPLDWSVACALRVVRRTMTGPPRTLRTLLNRLAAATHDTYVRRRSKKARNWPHKKNDPPIGEPSIRMATTTESKAAQCLKDTSAVV